MSEKTKPSAGAMRAAKLLAADMGPYYTGEHIAEIIDRESGLAELLEAIRWLMSCFNEVGELEETYEDQFSVGWEKCEKAILKASNPNADVKQAYPKGRYDTV